MYTKERLIAKAIEMGYSDPNNRNSNYLSKDLGNGWVIDLQWWGKKQKPNIIATHKKLGGGVYVPYTANHFDVVKTPMKDIVVNKRYVRLVEGTSFPLKLVQMALQTLELRLLNDTSKPWTSDDYYTFDDACNDGIIGNNLENSKNNSIFVNS